MMTSIDLSQLEFESVLRDEPLRNHTSWRIGGPADILVQPGSGQELSNLLRFIAANALPYVVIGDGSNVLFDDAGFRGVVVKIGRRMSACRIEGQTVHVQAGMAVPRLARRTALAGLTGLEHTVGIPGTVGGLAAMNGGSLGAGIGDCIKTVTCVDRSGERMEFARQACEFSYRHSIFLGKPWIITDVVLELEAGNRDAIMKEMLAVLRQRRQKFPRRLPNCGSVFKRHAGLFEAWGPQGKVIEDLGFKGFPVGDAEVSRQHANFIINRGHARAADVLALIRMIRDKVHTETGFWLECEVRYVSPTGQIGPAHLDSR